MELIDLRKISVHQILANPAQYLLKNKEYLIVCERGIKSRKTSEILNNMGYHTYSAKSDSIINKK